MNMMKVKAGGPSTKGIPAISTRSNQSSVHGKTKKATGKYFKAATPAAKAGRVISNPSSGNAMPTPEPRMSKNMYNPKTPQPKQYSNDGLPRPAKFVS